MGWYLAVLRKYTVFGGRAGRREYWIFALINFILIVLLTIVDSSIDTFNADAGIGLLGGVYTLAVLLPGLAVTARRLHDTGRGGWWLLLLLIPLIGPLVLLIFMVQSSQPDGNRYGPNPDPIAM